MGDDSGEDDACAAVAGVFVVAGGDGPELLDSVEEPFDDVPALVDGLIEVWGTTTGTALGFAATDLVIAFRIVTAILRRRNAARVEGWEYALSATTRQTLAPVVSKTSSNRGFSPAWPGVTTTERRCPTLSTATWDLVDQPPREWPKP